MYRLNQVQLDFINFILQKPISFNPEGKCGFLCHDMNVTIVILNRPTLYSITDDRRLSVHFQELPYYIKIAGLKTRLSQYLV